MRILICILSFLSLSMSTFARFHAIPAEMLDNLTKIALEQGLVLNCIGFLAGNVQYMRTPLIVNFKSPFDSVEDLKHHYFKDKNPNETEHAMLKTAVAVYNGTITSILNRLNMKHQFTSALHFADSNVSHNVQKRYDTYSLNARLRDIQKNCSFVRFLFCFKFINSWSFRIILLFKQTNIFPYLESMDKRWIN